ncbi:Phage DNA packaging protein Nu1 [compost metagenome]
MLDNRLRHAEQKQQPAGNDAIDPLVEIKLVQERLRLTAAQAYAQEQKNLVNDRQLVPVPFATFALSKIAAQIGSKLETIGKTLRRRHPDIDLVFIESLERELAMARNVAAGFGEQLPEMLDEYLESLAE